MPLQLNIDDDEQIESLREFFSAKANELNLGIAKRQSELKKINSILAQLGLKGSKLQKNVKAEVTEANPSGDYSSNWTWEQKAKFVLNKRGDLTAKQIVEIISDEFEPEIDKIKALNSLPATISVSAINGKLKRYKNANDEYVYAILTKE